MKRGIAFALIAHVILSLPSVWADEDLSLPATAAPALMKVSFAKDGLLRLRTMQPAWKKFTSPAGQDYYAPDGAREQVNDLKEKDIAKIYDNSGKPVAFKELPALLQKEQLAFYHYGEKIEPAHLRLLKEGTLIFCLVAPLPPVVYQQAPVKTTEKQKQAPVDGLGELLKKQGYLAFPLTRLAIEQLALQVEIKGKKVSLLVDTGATLTSLDHFRLRQLPLEWNDEAQSVLDDIKIGALNTGQITVGAFDMTNCNRYNKANNDPMMDGLLGADVMRIFSAVIDHPGAILYLRKPAPKKNATAEPPLIGQE
jgi:gag-polyprotein putative aspartyl protease